MAYQNAKGNAPSTGAPGPTPAPTKKVIPNAPDEVTSVRAPTFVGRYGLNGYAGASSAEPKQAVTSPMADNLRGTVDDDGVLDRVIAGDLRRDVGDPIADQQRPISAEPMQAAHGQVSQTGASADKPMGTPKAGATVPAKIGSAS